MREHPLLMKGPLVRATLEGRKTQTRRPIKCGCNHLHEGGNPVKLFGEWSLSRPPHQYTGGDLYYWRGKRPELGDWIETVQTDVDDCLTSRVACPLGKAGDRLWVRENGWERPDRTRKQMREGADTWAPYYYDADGICVADIDGFGFKRRPSIHMPRWASRITLEITAIRVERLQEISEEDAEAEGVYEHLREPQVECDGQVWHFPDASFVRGYISVWESIHGPGSWAANPFVWVLEFKRVEGEK